MYFEAHSTFLVVPRTVQFETCCFVAGIVLFDNSWHRSIFEDHSAYSLRQFGIQFVTVLPDGAVYSLSCQSFLSLTAI